MNPKLRMRAQCQSLKQEVENLRAVGRGSDANERVLAQLAKIYQEWKKDIFDPGMLSIFASAAIDFGALQEGKEKLKGVLKANETKKFLDATTLYYELGRIYHRLCGTCEKELWAFHMGTEAEAPANCKFPATRTDKARCHFFAWSCAGALGEKEHVDWHLFRLGEIAPEVDVNNLVSVRSLLESGLERGGEAAPKRTKDRSPQMAADHWATITMPVIQSYFALERELEMIEFEILTEALQHSLQLLCDVLGPTQTIRGLKSSTVDIPSDRFPLAMNACVQTYLAIYTRFGNPTRECSLRRALLKLPGGNAKLFDEICDPATRSFRALVNLLYRDLFLSVGEVFITPPKSDSDGGGHLIRTLAISWAEMKRNLSSTLQG